MVRKSKKKNKIECFSFQFWTITISILVLIGLLVFILFLSPKSSSFTLEEFNDDAGDLYSLLPSDEEMPENFELHIGSSNEAPNYEADYQRDFGFIEGWSTVYWMDASRRIDISIEKYPSNNITSVLNYFRKEYSPSGWEIEDLGDLNFGNESFGMKYSKGSSEENLFVMFSIEDLFIAVKCYDSQDYENLKIIAETIQLKRNI